MRMTFDEYDILTEKLQRIENPDPTYVPNADEIDMLWNRTQTLRPETCSSDPPEDTFKTGRPDTYLEQLFLIPPGKPGEPYLTEQDVLLYLLFINFTAAPSSSEGKADLTYLVSFICSHLELTD